MDIWLLVVVISIQRKNWRIFLTELIIINNNNSAYSQYNSYNDNRQTIRFV